MKVIELTSAMGMKHLQLMAYFRVGGISYPVLSVKVGNLAGHPVMILSSEVVDDSLPESGEPTLNGIDWSKGESQTVHYSPNEGKPKVDK